MIDKFTAQFLSKSDDIKPKISVKSLDVSTASKNDLMTLPKIGPVTAEKIIQYRDDFGPFKSIEDLLKIKGIGQKTLDQLKTFIQIKIQFETTIKHYIHVFLLIVFLWAGD